MGTDRVGPGSVFFVSQWGWGHLPCVCLYKGSDLDIKGCFLEKILSVIWD